jgi:hypothetical protein
MEPISIALAIAKLTGLDEKIGHWIGGENGAKVADKVISIAQEMTDSKDGQSALNMLKTDSMACDEFYIRIKEHERELASLAFADRQDARAMQVKALEQEDKFSKHFIYYFAWFWSIFATLYISGVTFIQLPETGIRFADNVQGFLLGTIVATILFFFYGSSDGSKKKDEAQYRLGR